MEDQDAIAATVIGQPRRKLIGKAPHPLLQLPPQIEGEHIHYGSNKRNGMNAPCVVHLDVPPKVLRLCPQPPKYDHRDLGIGMPGADTIDRYCAMGEIPAE